MQAAQGATRAVQAQPGPCFCTQAEHLARAVACAITASLLLLLQLARSRLAWLRLQVLHSPSDYTLSLHMPSSVLCC